MLWLTLFTLHITCIQLCPFLKLFFLDKIIESYIPSTIAQITYNFNLTCTIFQFEGTIAVHVSLLKVIGIFDFILEFGLSRF